MQELYEKCFRAATYVIYEEKFQEEIEEREQQFEEISKKERALRHEMEKKQNIIWYILAPVITALFTSVPAFAFLAGGGAGVLSLFELLGEAFQSGEPEALLLSVLYIAFVAVIALIGIAFFCAPIIVLLILIAVNARHKKKAPKKYNEYYENTYAPEYARLTDEIERLKQRREDFREEYTGALDFLPMDYREGIPVVYIFNYVKNGRADTLKEALNLFEQERRHWEQMQALQEVAAMQAEYYDAAISEIQHNTAVLQDIRMIETINLLNQK